MEFKTNEKNSKPRAYKYRWSVKEEHQIPNEFFANEKHRQLSSESNTKKTEGFQEEIKSKLFSSNSGNSHKNVEKISFLFAVLGGCRSALPNRTRSSYNGLSE